MKQNIEKVVLKGCFFWFFLALHYLCGYAAKVLPLGNAQINLAFRSFNRTFELRSKVLPLEKAKSFLLFPRLIVPLAFGRKYSHSEMLK